MFRYMAGGMDHVCAFVLPSSHRHWSEPWSVGFKYKIVDAYRRQHFPESGILECHHAVYAEHGLWHDPAYGCQIVLGAAETVEQGLRQPPGVCAHQVEHLGECLAAVDYDWQAERVGQVDLRR